MTLLSADPGRTSQLHPALSLRLACPVFLGPVSREHNSLLYLSSHLREFARAVLTQQHTLASSNDSRVLSHSSGGWWITVSSGLAPSEAVREGLFRRRPRLLVVRWHLCVPWFLLASPQSLPSGSRGVSLSAHLPLCPVLPDTGHVGLGATVLQDELILTNPMQ